MPNISCGYSAVCVRVNETGRLDDGYIPSLFHRQRPRPLVTLSNASLYFPESNGSVDPSKFGENIPNRMDDPHLSDDQPTSKDMDQF